MKEKNKVDGAEEQHLEGDLWSHIQKDNQFTCVLFQNLQVNTDTQKEIEFEARDH